MRDFINIVMELFDTEAKLRWMTSTNGEEIAATFTLDRFRYNVFFALVHWTGKWECIFELDFGYGKGKGRGVDSFDPLGVLGTGNAAKVLSIVCMAIQQFIEKKSPRAIEFSADEDSRRKLYGTMAKTLSSRLPEGYRTRQLASNVWVIERMPKEFDAGKADHSSSPDE